MRGLRSAVEGNMLKYSKIVVPIFDFMFCNNIC